MKPNSFELNELSNFQFKQMKFQLNKLFKRINTKINKYVNRIILIRVSSIKLCDAIAIEFVLRIDYQFKYTWWGHQTFTIAEIGLTTVYIKFLLLHLFFGR